MAEKPPWDEWSRTLAEYGETRRAFEHNADLRFKQLTLFGAVTAALVTGYSSAVVPAEIKLAFPVLGVLVAIVFFALEHRISAYRQHYFQRMRVLQVRLGFMPSLQLGRRRRGIVLYAVLFGAVVVLWELVCGVVLWRLIL